MFQEVFEDITSWENSILSPKTNLKEETLKKMKKGEKLHWMKVLCASGVQNRAEKHYFKAHVRGDAVLGITTFCCFSHTNLGGGGVS